MQGAVLGTEELGTKWVYLLQGGMGGSQTQEEEGQKLSRAAARGN